ncbi:transposase [bacterium]|nr:transposase [bacterium]
MRHLSNIRNKYFIQFDRHLDSLITGPDWLNNHEIAGIVETGIQFYHLKNYKLIAYTLMPNHVHMIVRMLKSGDGLSPYYLSNTIGRLKSFTAQKANQILKRTGPFWQQENYDHVVRNDGELSRIIEYILNNPVKAGLSETWEQYPYSYCKF